MKIINKSFQISSYAVPFTSYGELAEQILRSMLKMVDEVMFRPFSFSEAFGATNSPIITNNMLTKPLPNYFDYELLINPPNALHIFRENSYPPSRRILFTMWESTRLNPIYVQEINKSFAALIVPDEHNRQLFKKSGIKLPIYIVPLWVDTDIFKPRQKLLANECTVFGCAARLSVGGIRKNVTSIIEAFKLAFRGINDVKLVFKCFSDCEVDEEILRDERISTIRAFISPDSVADWLSGLDAYITASSEGWGWFQQQAVACGVPLVGVNYGPLKQFFNGYETAYDLVRANRSVYDSVGHQVSVDPLSLAEKMKYVYNNTAEAFVKGHAGSAKAMQFDIDNFEAKLNNTLLRITNGR